MPTDFPTWLFYAVAGSAVLFFAPKAWDQIKRLFMWGMRTLGDEVGVQVIRALEDRLQPSWEADFGDMLDEALFSIRYELTDNSGNSLRDVVTTSALHIKQIQTDIEPLVLAHQKRYDPPGGTPT